MPKYVIFVLAVVGALSGVSVVLSLRHRGPATHPTPGLVAVFPFDGAPDVSRELAARLGAVRLPRAVDPQRAAVQAGVRLYVVGSAGPELRARLFDVTAPWGPRAEGRAPSVDELARQLQGGVLGAAVPERPRKK